MMGRGGRGGPMMGRGRGGPTRDPLMSKSIVIIGGPYKGYLGIVKDINNETARVELHTSYKTVTVQRSQIQLSSQSSRGAPSGGYAGTGANSSGYDPNRAGSYGSGARTPMHDGGRTPAWNSGSKTPAWDSGSKTPAWDAGSKTPAWNAGSKTPAWDAGSKTPAWDAGSRTPGRSNWESSNYNSSSYNSIL